MEKEKIVNVYELVIPNNKISYMYSVRKDNDFLGFTYYILTKSEENETNIYETDATLNLLQDNNIKLIPIKNDPSRYEKFLTELEIGLNSKYQQKGILIKK